MQNQLNIKTSWIWEIRKIERIQDIVGGYDGCEMSFAGNAQFEWFFGENWILLWVENKKNGRK